jgi:1-aminocyclopropane-1-carboxylate deaminase/D-cysteine desulfhydrase-like pyridoxal-dependent ACC family enzyme
LSDLSIELFLPKCFRVDKLETRAGEVGCVECVQEIVKRSHDEKQKMQAIGFINGKGAHFANAFMVLEIASSNAEPFAVHIQDKQSTVARKNHISGKIPELVSNVLEVIVHRNVCETQQLWKSILFAASCLPLHHRFMLSNRGQLARP